MKFRIYQVYYYCSRWQLQPIASQQHLLQTMKPRLGKTTSWTFVMINISVGSWRDGFAPLGWWWFHGSLCSRCSRLGFPHFFQVLPIRNPLTTKSWYGSRNHVLHLGPNWWEGLVQIFIRDPRGVWDWRVWVCLWTGTDRGWDPINSDRIINSDWLSHFSHCQKYVLIGVLSQP